MCVLQAFFTVWLQISYRKTQTKVNGKEKVFQLNKRGQIWKKNLVGYKPEAKKSKQNHNIFGVCDDI